MRANLIARLFVRPNAPFALLGFAFFVGAFAHGAAMQRIGNISWDFVVTQSELFVQGDRILFVGFVDTHPWHMLALAAFFFATLAWLRASQAPRSFLWTTVCVQALPILAYAWICFFLKTSSSFDLLKEMALR